MSILDWSIVGGYIILVSVVGLLFIRRASGSVDDFFVAGRKLPWWIAGTSLIATSFAADTPLAISGLVARGGISGNWMWWSQIVAWTLAVAFFAKLWRRTGLLTDAEFIELRYGGQSGAFLRGFKALYVSLIFSTGTLAWVMLAMQKIVDVAIGEPAWIAPLEKSVAAYLGMSAESIDLWKWFVLIALFMVATVYTVLSGFWGIVVTDLIQFTIAIVASMIFAGYAVHSVGGLAGLQEGLVERLGTEQFGSFMSFFSTSDTEQHKPLWSGAEGTGYLSILIFITVNWWGDCSGGIGTQRLFSTRSERDSILAVIWYNLGHFVIRIWPWILVALVAMIHFPQSEDPEANYPQLMMTLLPSGMRGLMIASLLAAFMSTVDTHLNWNSSYFVNDIYRRFLKKSATQKQCVAASRWSTLGFAALAITIAAFIDSIGDAWLFLFNIQAGLGMVLMVRWFWWRVSAWSEISAMIASLAVTTVLPMVSSYYGYEWSGPFRILLTTIICTPVWIIVTLIAQPPRAETLDNFYTKVRPPGPFWKPLARRNPDVFTEQNLARPMIGWLVSAVGLFSLMFLIGQLLFLQFQDAMISGIVLTASIVILYLLYRGANNPLSLQ